MSASSYFPKSRSHGEKGNVGSKPVDTSNPGPKNDKGIVPPRRYQEEQARKKDYINTKSGVKLHKPPSSSGFRRTHGYDQQVSYFVILIFLHFF